MFPEQTFSVNNQVWYISLLNFLLLLDELSLRSKAIDLVDSVLEESVQYLSSRLDSDDFEGRPQKIRGAQEVRFDNYTIDCDDFGLPKDHNNFFDQPPALNINISDNLLHSESENYAITCDLSNGAEFLKSPTIESISGKSFDENMSPHEERDLLDIHLPSEKLETTEWKTTKTDRKFEALSKDFETEGPEDVGAAFEILEGEDVSQLQNEFSKLSWDESQSTTTIDPNLSTPDNDLQGQEGDLKTRQICLWMSLITVPTVSNLQPPTSCFELSLNVFVWLYYSSTPTGISYRIITTD